MKTAQQQVTIQVPVDKVWSAISQLDKAAEQNAEVTKSLYISEKTSGVGTKRMMEQKNGKIQMDHVVIDWQEGKKITMESTRVEGLPIVKDRITLEVSPQGEATQLKVIYSYQFKGLASLFAGNKTVEKGLRKSVLSCKHHFETGEAVDNQLYKQKIAPKYKSLNTSVNS